MPPLVDFARRSLRGLALGVGLCLAITAVLVPFRVAVGEVSPTATYILAVTITGLVSTPLASIATTVLSGMLLNYNFMRPIGSLKIGATEDIAGFITYTLMCAVATVVIARWKATREVALASERRAEAAAERAERGEERIAWLQRVSHEIRTPLSTIRAVIEDFVEGIEYPEATREELLRSAGDEVERLDRLVDNWLLLGSMDASPEAAGFVSVDLGEVVTDAVRRVAPLARGRRIDLSVDADVDPVDGDHRELLHLALNLLTNAIRYGSEHGPIGVRVHAVGDAVTLVVEDDGPGFPLNDRDRLLLPFVAGSASDSSGLGLAICSEISRRHHATIRLEDAKPEGARVVVLFPRRVRVARR